MTKRTFITDVTFPTEDSIANFKYDGMFIHPIKGFARYKAVSFVKWTTDPGVFVIRCSDGKDRLIPTCQTSEEFKKNIPPQPKHPMAGKGFILGEPSSSD